MSRPLYYLDWLLRRLERSIRLDHAQSTCHRKWSQFIRERDRFKCVICDGVGRVAAHHIVRKSLFPSARLLPGNGATLCAECHKESHEGFNGEPKSSLPIDAEGGEKLEGVAELFRIQASNFRSCYPDRPIYYHIDIGTLTSFGKMQGSSKLPVGEAIEIAWAIWDAPPEPLATAILSANFPTG